MLGTEKEFHDNLVNSIFGSFVPLKEEYYEEETCKSEENCPDFMENNPKIIECMKDSVLSRIRNIIMPSEKVSRTTTSLNAKSRLIIENEQQFRVLKEMMNSSGMITNEGIQQILPSLIDCQYRKITENKKPIDELRTKGYDKIQGAMEDCKHDKLRNYGANFSTYVRGA